MEEAKTANNTAITLGTAAHDGDNLEVVTIVNLLGFPAFWSEDQPVVFDHHQTRVVAKLLNDQIEGCC